MSFLSDHLEQVDTAVLDASALINLLGTGEELTLLRALNTRFLIEEKTRREIRRHPIMGMAVEEGIAGLTKSGLLIVDRMSEREYGVYLSLVQKPLAERLGDGESAAISLSTRGYGLVLDENKARGIVATTFPTTHVCSFMGLILTAAHRQGWPVSTVQRLLLAARRHARMGVPKDQQTLLEDIMRGVDGWPVTWPTA